MKRRPRGTHLGARKGGRGTGGADRRRWAELRWVALRAACCCEERGGRGADLEAGSVSSFYRAEGRGGAPKAVGMVGLRRRRH
jgi:hypothetical protein